MGGCSCGLNVGAGTVKTTLTMGGKDMKQICTDKAVAHKQRFVLKTWGSVLYAYDTQAQCAASETLESPTRAQIVVDELNSQYLNR